MAFGLPFSHGLTLRSFNSHSFSSLLACCFAGRFLGINRGGDERRFYRVYKRGSCIRGAQLVNAVVARKEELAIWGGC